MPPDLKTYGKAIVIKIVRYSHNDKHVDQLRELRIK